MTGPQPSTGTFILAFHAPNRITSQMRNTFESVRSTCPLDPHFRGVALTYYFSVLRKSVPRIVDVLCSPRRTSYLQCEAARHPTDILNTTSLVYSLRTSMRIQKGVANGQTTMLGAYFFPYSVYCGSHSNRFQSQFSGFPSCPFHSVSFRFNPMIIQPAFTRRRSA